MYLMFYHMELDSIKAGSMSAQQGHTKKSENKSTIMTTKTEEANRYFNSERVLGRNPLWSSTEPSLLPFLLFPGCIFRVQNTFKIDYFIHHSTLTLKIWCNGMFIVGCHGFLHIRNCVSLLMRRQ